MSTVSSATAPMQAITLKFSAHSFRHLPTPLETLGVNRYYSSVSLDSIPLQLAQWIDVNPREATEKGRVANGISTTLNDQPEWFELFNRGLTVLTESVEWDNAKREISIHLSDRDLHGVADGNSSLYNSLLRVADLKEKNQSAGITIEFVTGLTSKEDVVNFSRARNTSVQVQEKSLADQNHKFDDLQRAMSQSGIDPDRIAWHENDSGEMEVQELVALITLFNRDRYGDDNHPIQAYSGKGANLKRFLNEIDQFEKVFPLVGDIIKLQEWIRYYVPKQQLADKSRFGGITGITSLNAPKKNGKVLPQKFITLPFTGLKTEHVMSDAYVYPVMAGFRALLADGPDAFKWGRNVNPEEVVKEGLASRMFRQGVFPTEQQLHNAMAVGKTSSVWNVCYLMGKVYYSDLH